MSRPIDALICGGGVTGLWLRALLQSYGRSVVLIEAEALGSAQTIAAQGILHSGAKYTAGQEARGEMLAVLPVMTHAWQQRLAGENTPDLRGTVVVSRESWYFSRDGALPACLELWQQAHSTAAEPASPPAILGPEAAALRNTSEWCIAPKSLVQVLAGDRRADLLHVPAGHVRWALDTRGHVASVRLSHPATQDTLDLQPRYVYLAAGAGNASLRESLGLPGETVIQRRPLRMGMMRGRLPRMCGHWFDEDGPRLTISTQFDSSGRTIWQLGGRLAEPPHDEPIESFLKRARCEVQAGVPDLDLYGVAWSSYHAVRAEPSTPDGELPWDGEILVDGNVVTLWPTKLTLLPGLMVDIRRALDRDGPRPPASLALPAWPRPPVAQPPWERATSWYPDEQVAAW